MKSYCLASSSAGNCYIFEFDIKGVPTYIMVECGIPYSEILRKSSDYGIMLSNISACLITHAHGDHCCSARKLVGIPIFAHKSTLERIGVVGNQLIPNCPNRVLNGLFVFPFYVEHDIEGALGFVIKTPTETVIFVNDNKRWTINLINFKPDYVFIECNYDHTMVYAQLNSLMKRNKEIANDDPEFKENSEKIKQHKRNLDSHMSLNGCLKGLHKLDLCKCKAIFLMHMSDRYANEYKMKNEIQTEFGIPTYVCKKKGGIK